MAPITDDELVSVTLENSLLRLRWAPGARISEAAAQRAMAEVNKLAGSSRYPMLVDMSLTESVSRPARTVFSLPCAADTIALLGRSPVDRVIANFILGVSKLPVPTKFFNSEPAALAWLKETRDAPQS